MNNALLSCLGGLPWVCVCDAHCASRSLVICSAGCSPLGRPSCVNRIDGALCSQQGTTCVSVQQHERKQTALAGRARLRAWYVSAVDCPLSKECEW